MTECSDKGLLANANYYYRVRAVNIAGASGYSNIGDVITYGDIVLSATGSKVKGNHVISLDWSGTLSGNVSVYRDGILVAQVADSETYIDQTGNRGKWTYTYQVCEQVSAWECSNMVTVRF